jgi:ribosomal protein S18 acetylase RimI-like enzyme
MILKNNIQICKATHQDVEALIPLLKLLFSIEKDFIFNEQKHTQGLTLLLNNPHALIAIAKFEEEIIAMVTMQTIISTAMGSKTGLIEDFVVSNDFQDLGIGTHLFEYLKQYAKEQQLDRMQLLCDNDNLNAKEFYTKKSFQKSNLSGWYYHL